MAGALPAGVPRPRTHTLHSLGASGSTGGAAFCCSLFSSGQPRPPGLGSGESEDILDILDILYFCFILFICPSPFPKGCRLENMNPQ